MRVNERFHSVDLGGLWKQGAVSILLLALMTPPAVQARKFYDDDPLAKEPTPISLEDARFRKLNDFYDLFLNTFTHPGQQRGEKIDGVVHESLPAQAVNTLGEVYDSAWFTNRIGSRPMSVEEVLAGPGVDMAPSMDGPWTITGAKTEGVTPGFRFKDSKGRKYVLKFDPVTHPEMATGADFIGSQLFHALGYNVPQNYVVVFDENRLELGEGITVTDVSGEERPMSERDVTAALKRVPRRADGSIRAVASLFLPGKILGEFRYFGTRTDDPNDIVRHEHRRDLRGLFVFCAWLNHNDSRAINSLDSLVEENGVRFVKHFLIDFGAILGSASIYSNTARDGNAYFWEFKSAFTQILTLGAAVPWWARSHYEKHPALGMLMFPRFEPERWKPNYPSPAFDNRLPDDEFWAAKKVMAFSDEQIAAVVKGAQYSDDEATKLLTDYLIRRRNRIGEVYFAKVLPLDGFRVEGGELKFEDLGVKHGLVNSRDLRAEWSRFDNEAETHTAIAGASGFRLPDVVTGGSDGAYFSSKVRGGDETKSVTVYLRKRSPGFQVVGVDRTW